MSDSVLAKEFDAIAKRNDELLNTPAGEGKSLAESSEKEAEFESGLKRLEELKGLIEKSDRFDTLKSWASTPERAAAAFAPEAPEREAKTRGVSPGSALVNSTAFKSYLNRIAPDGRISDNTTVESEKFELKALVTGGSTGAGAFFELDYTGLYSPYTQAQLTVRNLVLNLRTDADVVGFVQSVAHTNAAAEVAEAVDALPGAISGATPGPYTVADPSGLKPEGAFTFVQVTNAIVPIAEGVPISKRSLMNASMIEDIINSQLIYDTQARLNSQMIAGTGSGANLRGIRNTVGIQTQAFSNNIIETVRKSKTKVADPTTGSGKIADGAVLAPADMEKLDLFRVGGSTTTDGSFLINPFGDAPRRMWGINLVEDAGMTAGKAVVGYFRDAVLWDRQQATVEVFNQHKDFAGRNLVYLLAEWWGTFGVLTPRSFVDASTV